MIYVILAEHGAHECPTANTKTRDLMLKGAPEIPKIAQKLGVKILAGPYVNWEHVTVLVVQCEKAAALFQMVAETGLSQWNRVRTIPSQTLEEGMKEIQRSKPLY